jgi:hypothetical protein
MLPRAGASDFSSPQTESNGALRAAPQPITYRPRSTAMRAEIETIVEEIKQSAGLLRRHL